VQRMGCEDIYKVSCVIGGGSGRVTCLECLVDSNCPSLATVSAIRHTFGKLSKQL
jgi:hypothetical protein